ncbi:MAG: hypothetical protein ABF289_11740 [Clostridiales bacterium]
MKNDQKRQQIIGKLNEIQSEILLIGWNGVIEKYHPDFNLDDTEANNVFKLYKHVYENMKQRVSISNET